MGSYINRIDKEPVGASAYEKITALIKAGAVAVKEDVDENNEPLKYQENLVVVVDNGHFAAAAYAYSEKEYKYFLSTPGDKRMRFWFTFDRAKEFAEPKYWK